MVRPPQSLRAYRTSAAGVGLATLIFAACCGLLALLGQNWGLTLPFVGRCAGCPARGDNQTFVAYLITNAHPGDRALLDPAEATDPAARTVTRLLFDGLVTLDKNLKPELWGADRVDVSPDGLTYTFHLRPGQRFSDGRPVQASDYAWSLERLVSPCTHAATDVALLALQDAPAFAAEPCNGGKPAGKIQTLQGSSIIANDGAGTLALVVSQPTGGFLTMLASAPAYALEHEVVSPPAGSKNGSWPSNLTHGATGQGGSGMFYVAGIDKHALTLRPNPVWWGQGAHKAPNLSELDVKLYGDATAAYKAFQADPTAAYLSQIPTGQLQGAASDAGYREGPALRMEGIAFNWNVAPFDKLDAREAFCLAINRDQYAATPGAGLLEPTWHVTARGISGYDRSLDSLDGAPTAGDAEKATRHWQAYLTALGIQNSQGTATPTATNTPTPQPTATPQPTVKPPSVTFSFASDSPTQQALAAVLQADLQATLGVKVQLSGSPAGALADAVRGKGVQAYPVVWGSDVPDPQFFLTRPFSSGAAENFANAGVPEADALLAQADIASDPMHDIARMQIYNQAEQYLVDNVVICPVAQLHLAYEVRPWAHGLAETGDGLIPLDNWSAAVLTKDKPEATTATASAMHGA